MTSTNLETLTLKTISLLDQIPAASTVCGVVMDFTNINPVQALYWTAVVNGLLAPFLLVGILLVARDNTIMNGQPSSMISQVVVLCTTLLAFSASIAMFVI